MNTHISEEHWREYRDNLFRFVLRRVNDPVVAEDIVHDVILKAYQRLGTLREYSKVRQWLYQISRNAITDYFRAKRSDSLPPDYQAPDKADSGEQARHELARCILPMIRELPENYREAVTLSELEGLSQKEVAQRQNISLSGAKSRIQRGRKLLEGMFHACCRLEFDRRGALNDYQPKSACGTCRYQE